MTDPDDELDAQLRAVRPPTTADDGWAASAAGDEALTRITAATVETPAPRAKHGRRIGVAAAGLAAVAAVAVVVSLAVSGPEQSPTPRARPVPGHQAVGPYTGPRPADVALASYDSCPAALTGLRSAAATHRLSYQQNGDVYAPPGLSGLDTSMRLSSLAPSPTKSAEPHSTTNTQESGVDEPDVVKTDGRRLVSITGGVLRVVDVATREVTGRLDLTIYSGGSGAQLLLAGDRALVLLGNSYSGGFAPTDYPIGPVGSGFLLVDLAGKSPRVVSTFRPRGGLVDARVVGGEARLVVRSNPTIEPVYGNGPAAGKAWRARVARTPLSAWLPSWTTTSPDGSSRTGTLPCGSLAHPAQFSGANVLTVYSVPLTKGFDELQPVSVTADSAAVYGQGSNLYVAASFGTRSRIHRFDVTAGRRPTYLGSGIVPGSVRDSYSLSEYAGTLRVVSTSGFQRSVTSLYSLDADTLAIKGKVGGLGRNEQVYGVRFAGPYGYVVTFRKIDPLYVLDLRDPAKPRTAGTLKVTGNSQYLHDLGGGRLLGVGQTIGGREPNGAQATLFDVANPARPTKLDSVERPGAQADVDDPHAFLYWAPARTAFVPLRNWNDGVGRVLVLRVDAGKLTVRGTVAGARGAVRTVVIGDDVWLVSDGGVRVAPLAKLADTTRIPFS